MFTFLDAVNRLPEAPFGAERERLREKISEAMGLGTIQRQRFADYAADMLGVLNRIGEIRPGHLPDAEGARGRDRFVFLPSEDPVLRRLQEPLLAEYSRGRIVFVRGDDGHWRFSPETVSGIESFYRAVRDLDRRYVAGVDEHGLSRARWIETLLPRSLVEGELVGLRYWQWVGLFLVILVGVVLDHVVRAGLRFVWGQRAKRSGAQVADVTLSRAVRPFGLFAAALVWLIGIQPLALPEGALYVLLPAVRLFLMLAGVWAGFRVTDLLAEAAGRRARRSRTRLDNLLIPLVRRAAKVFVAVLGVIYIADSFDIEIVPLLTGLGIGGLAFAFAAKDTIENFFGSVAVIVDRPFEVGDWVRIGDSEGIVEELGLRSTRIRTFYNSLVTVPNATLVRANVDNYGRRKYRRISTHISVTYDTPPDKIEAFCAGIRELIRVHPYTRKDFYCVWLNQFAAASLDIWLYCFHETPDWQTELRERHRLFLDIIRLAHRLGVEFAFPTQTIYLRRDDGAAPESEGKPVSADAESSAYRTANSLVEEITRLAPWRAGKPEPYRFPDPPPPPTPKSQVETRRGGSE